MTTTRIGLVGLGYVGLPLAVALGRKYPTVGFDLDGKRVAELKRGLDKTREVTAEELRSCTLASFTSNARDLSECNYHIIAVPTPVDRHKSPDLRAIIAATETVGSLLKEQDIVIYESTVYPGCTEEVCVPILERASRMRFNADFCCGYSPERTNPGDREHSLSRVRKITSGSTAEAAEKVDRPYASIIEAGTHRVSSIRVAEAANVIENAQRDINIAFVNELSMIFHRLGIDAMEVLEAARTKWNFLDFRPGLVGGHCIVVDPFYLAYKAQEVGHYPEVILTGRRINDKMGKYIAGELIKLLIRKGRHIVGSRVLVLGITFKENCTDVRNSKAIDIVRESEDFGCKVDVHDPVADREDVEREHNLSLREPTGKYAAIILAVAHRRFQGLDLSTLVDESTVVFDVKGVLPRKDVSGRL